MPSLLMPSLDCAFFVPSLLMPSLDCALSLLMPAPPESRFIAPPEGAAVLLSSRWRHRRQQRRAPVPLAPPAPPAPCAKAKPLPAINAAAATDHHKTISH